MERERGREGEGGGAEGCKEIRRRRGKGGRGRSVEGGK